jgi:hypothetical protein
MEETVVDQKALDPACQVQDLPDKLRTQPKVGPIGAIPDLKLLEGYAVLRPPCGMPSQDRTRTQVVVLIEPILSPDALCLQSRGGAWATVIGFDLGRYVPHPMPSRFLSQLLINACEIFLEDLPRQGRSVKAASIDVSRFAGTNIASTTG